MEKIMFITIAVFVITALVLIFAGNYFYNIAINANTSKDFLNQSNHLGDVDTSGNLEYNWDLRQEIITWGEETYEQRKIESHDGLTLSSFLFKNQRAKNRYAIVVHGYMGKSLDMIVSIKHIYDSGYTVLAPDCRGCGESEGDYTGMGWIDRMDILRWIDMLIQNNPDAEIMLYGVSMGGAAVMMVSGEKLPENVKVIVEDCGYTSAEDILTYQLKDLFNLPKFPIIPSASLVTKIRAGYYLDEASAVKQVQKSVTPILFIHGDIDAFVPFSMLDILYEAANCPKEQYVVSGAGHGYSSSVEGDRYWKRVFDFVNRYIPSISE